MTRRPRPSRRSLRRIARALVLAALLGTGTARAQTPDPSPSPPPGAPPPSPSAAGTSETSALGPVTIDFGRSSRQPDGTLLLEGAVTITVGEGQARMQADRMVWREERWIDAEGNVLVVWEGNRISGARMHYDLKEDKGYVEDAIGVVQPGTDAPLYFTADRADKVGRDLVLLDDATVTTCTQPVPYWSFSVAHARVRLDHYAHLQHVRLRAKRVPLLYLPYLVWPVKPERSAGLLFPTFGSTRDRGEVFSLGLFVPFGRSADVTLVGEYYTEAGLGGGLRGNWLPNRQGKAQFEGFYIDDQVERRQGDRSKRHRATYKQTQNFANGFRMFADLNEVSDFAYFTDYERELSLASTPQILARLEFTRNGPWTSINVRELRREQLFSDGTSLVQQTFPEIEWRGRSKRVGSTPLYVSFESSLASIRQDKESEGTAVGAPVDADYLRADFFPTVTAPFSRLPWLDVTPLVQWRGTYYTQSRSQDAPPGAVIGDDEDVSRSLLAAGVEVVGPKLFRIYGGESGSDEPRYKHVVEPHVRYGYRGSDPTAGTVIQFDDVDRPGSASNQLEYGLRSRLFARRPRSEVVPLDGSAPPATLDLERTGGNVAGEDPAALAAEAAAEAAEAQRNAPQEPVEVLSFELRQNRSIDTDLRTEDLNGNGVLDTEDLNGNGLLDGREDLDCDGLLDPGEDADGDGLLDRGEDADGDCQLDFLEDLNGNGAFDRSRYSHVVAMARYNPSPSTSVDLRTRYDPLFEQIDELSLSGNVYRRTARSAFSVVRRASVGPTQTETRTQIRLAAGVTLWGGKVRLDTDGSYDLERHRVPDQRYRVEFYTQCCGFLAEYLARDFEVLDRREFRFTVDLRGIGKFLDLHDSTE